MFRTVYIGKILEFAAFSTCFCFYCFAEYDIPTHLHLTHKMRIRVGVLMLGWLEFSICRVFIFQSCRNWYLFIYIFNLFCSHFNHSCICLLFSFLTLSTSHKVVIHKCLCLGCHIQLSLCQICSCYISQKWVKSFRR